jgi:putative hydrolase of the HAD superfamily
MEMIRAVLFDYGMVLSAPADAKQRKRMEELLHADCESFGTAYWRFRDAYDRGALTGAAYWNAVAEALGQRLNVATLENLIEADTLHWGQPNAAMIAWAEALQKAGVRTGILSNLGDAMEAGLRVRLPWLKDFWHATFSHRLGIAKPDAAIYTHAIEGMGVAADEILFVDDREENVLAARAAGMRAIQYGEHERFVSELGGGGFPQGLPVMERSTSRK